MRIHQPARRVLASEACPCKMENHPGPQVTTEIGIDFLQMAHDVLKQALNPVFDIESQDKETVLKVTAPKLNNQEVALAFKTGTEGDVVLASYARGEKKDVVAFQQFPCHAYAKYSAMFDDIIVWVSDKLFVPDAEIYGEVEEKATKESSADRLKQAMDLPEGDQERALITAVNMCMEEKLPKASAKQHFLTAKALKVASLRAMNQLAWNRDVLRPEDMRSIFKASRSMVIASLAHMLEARKLAFKEDPSLNYEDPITAHYEALEKRLSDHFEASKS